MAHQFDPIVVTTTCNDRNVLVEISKQLVSRNLAACVQISGPIASCYRWAGEIEMTDEWVCDMKSSMQRYDELEKVVLAMHTYDQPQLVATRIAAGTVDYLKWLAENLE